MDRALLKLPLLLLLSGVVGVVGVVEVEVADNDVVGVAVSVVDV